DELVVTVAGVGYRVTVDAWGIREGDAIELHVHSITNETGTRLYGFSAREQRNAFVSLLGVKGVGPSTARAIVAAGIRLPCGVEALTMVKGVGKKTAEAIVAHFAKAAA